MGRRPAIRRASRCRLDVGLIGPGKEIHRGCRRAPIGTCLTPAGGAPTSKSRKCAMHFRLSNSGAGNESRTRDLNLGKVALYQLSYSRFDDRAQILASFAPHRNTSLQLFYYWRRDSESNRGTRLCRPLHNHSAIAPRPFRPAAPYHLGPPDWALPGLRNLWSGKRVSNSRPQPWQGCALPTELFPLGKDRHYRQYFLFVNLQLEVFVSCPSFPSRGARASRVADSSPSTTA